MSEDAKFWLGVFVVVAAFVGLGILCTYSADTESVERIDNSNCLFVEDENNHAFAPDSRLRGVYCPERK